MPLHFQQDFTHRTDAPEGGALEIDLSFIYTYQPGRPAQGPAYDHGGLPPEPPEVEIQRVVTKAGSPFALSDDWMLHYSDRILENHDA